MRVSPALHCDLLQLEDRYRRPRVIDVFGEPIPGLYACGEATGGVHGAAYMTGTAFGKALSFGRIAALEIAKLK